MVREAVRGLEEGEKEGDAIPTPSPTSAPSTADIHSVGSANDQASLRPVRVVVRIARMV